MGLVNLKSLFRLLQHTTGHSRAHNERPKAQPAKLRLTVFKA